MTRDDAVASLQSAYDTADDLYTAAKMKGTLTEDRLKVLDHQRQQALLLYLAALKEHLVLDNNHTAGIKDDLDKAIAQMKHALAADQGLAEALNLIGKVVQLASTLAGAFA